MSGKPSPEGVREFRVLLKTMSDADKLRDTLTAEIARRQGNLKVANSLYQEARVKLLDLMEKMDIQADGHAGYEGRISWFLVELNQQFESGEPDA